MSAPNLMDRSPHFVLDKIIRWSSWPLFVFLGIFFATGYAMSGEFGFGKLMDAKQALAVHKLCHLPLIALILIHSLPAIYLQFRRWGWIGRKNKS
jgi:cytochrome b subunit of formate dehydrogenase